MYQRYQSTTVIFCIRSKSSICFWAGFRNGHIADVRATWPFKLYTNVVHRLDRHFCCAHRLCRVFRGDGLWYIRHNATMTHIAIPCKYEGMRVWGLSEFPYADI